MFLTGVPALYYKLLKSDTNTRTLASPQLRVADGLAAQAKFGERVTDGFEHVFWGEPLYRGNSEFQKIDVYQNEHFGRVLTLERRAGKGWKTIDKARTTATGRFTLTPSV